ncbi:MAG: alkaline phosphatase family protein [Bifidobacteriaceae bacterium]|nr:alkaline phosphatase family protein [Bifidobacteriaceae bacterium]
MDFMIEIPDTDQLLRLKPLHREDLVNETGVLPENLRHLSAVLPALSAAVGTPVPTAVHADPAAAQAALGLPSVTSAIVVLVDGMGYWNLAERLGHTPYLRALMNDSANARPIDTCYPSTTVAAMGTFGTGTAPGLTGMLGYTQLNPARDVISQMIQWTNAPRPEDLQRQPTVFEGIAANGGRATSVGLPNFKKSALTVAALRGPRYVGDVNPMSRVSKAAQAAREPGLTYLYARDADKAGHHYGWNSEEWVSKLEAIDHRLRVLHDEAPAGTLIVITADHGMVSIDPTDQVDIASVPVLSEGVHLVGGEPRALMLYCDGDVDPASVAGRWANYFGERARVLLRSEAVAAGLFGPVDDRILPMIGDVIVTAAARLTIVDSRIQNAGARAMPAVHGSATMAEQEIPLLIDVA